MEQGGTVLERISPTATWLTGVSERATASEPRERNAPAKRRARERVGESEGRSPSDKTTTLEPYADPQVDLSRILHRRRREEERRGLDAAEAREVRSVRQVVDRQREHHPVAPGRRASPITAALAVSLLYRPCNRRSAKAERVRDVRGDGGLRRRAGAVAADPNGPIVEERVVVVVEARRDVVRRPGVPVDRQRRIQVPQRLRIQGELLAMPAIPR